MSLTAAKINRLMLQMKRIEVFMQVNNMVSETEAAEILNVKRITLQTKVSRGKLEGFYTVSPVNGERFYYKDKILGLNIN